MFMPFFPVLDPLSLVALSDNLVGLISGEAREGTTITGNISGLSGGESITYKWQEDTGGGFADISGEAGASITVSIGANVTDGATLRRVPRVDGQDVFSNTAPMRYNLVVAAGALDDQSFSEDTGVQTYDVAGDFTLNGNTVSYTVNAVIGVSNVSSVVNFDSDVMAPQAATPVVVTATDAYGRTEASGFSVDILAVPDLDTFTYDDNNDGSNGVASSTYSGDLTDYSLQLETLTAGNGVIETTTVALGTGVPVTGFTTASNSTDASPAGTATQLRATLTGPNGPSNAITVAALGMDFGINGITWATSVDGTQIIGTSSADTLYFSEDVADWAISGVAAGAPTIDSVTGSGTTTLTLSLSGSLPQNGETLTIDYTDSDTNLRDQDGNLAADFAGTSVTNNVVAVVALNPSVSEILADLEGGAETDFTYSAPTNVPSEAAGRHAIVAVSYIIRQDQPAISVTVGGTSLTLVSGSLIELGTRGYAIFSGNVPTGSTVLVSTGTGSQWCWHCSATITWTDRAPVFGTPVTAAANTNSIDLDINTTDGGELIGGGTYGNASPTPTGVTIADTLSMSGDERTYALRQSVVTGETPRDVNITWSGVAVDRTFSLVEMT